MSFEHQEEEQVLKQLWGSQVPDLTPEQIEVSINLWQKIKARKQQIQPESAAEQQQIDSESVRRQ